MKAISNATEATKGEVRNIRVDGSIVEVTCAMLLGYRFDAVTGTKYRECIWHRNDNGRSVHGCASECWEA